MYNSPQYIKINCFLLLLANSAWKCPTRSICTSLLKHMPIQSENIYLSKKNDKLVPVIVSDIKQENTHYPHIKKWSKLLPVLTIIPLKFYLLQICFSHLSIFINFCYLLSRFSEEEPHTLKKEGATTIMWTNWEITLNFFSPLICKRTLVSFFFFAARTENSLS